MKPQKRDNKKSAGLLASKLMLAFMVVLAMLPLSGPAKAQGCVTVCDPLETSITSAFKIANTAALGVIGGILTALNTFTQLTQYPAQMTALTGISAAINGNSAIQMQANVQMEKYRTEANANMAMLTEGARVQADATLSQVSLICPNVNYMQQNERMGEGEMIAGALEHWVMESCQGQNADCSGPNQMNHLYDNLCQLGMLSQQGFGTLVGGCKQPPNQNYENLMGKIAVLLNQKQLEMASGCQLADGFISFAPNDTNCQKGTHADAAFNQDPTQDKGLWAGLFLVCETLYTPTEMPYGNRQPTAIDKRNIALASMSQSVQGRIMHKCFLELGKRTAVPGDVIFQADGGEQMHTTQVAQCTSMTNTAQNGGLNYTSDLVLQNCNKAGLSALYRDYATDHFCLDMGATTIRVQNTHSADRAEEQVNSCKASAREYNNTQETVNAALAAEIQSALQAKTANISAGTPNSGSRSQ